MSEEQVDTLRVPDELKSRQETLSGIEERLRSKNLSELKKKVSVLLDKVPCNPDLPEWDRL